ncbi:hemolysin expression modulating protein, partial [Thalassospira marina]
NDLMMGGAGDDVINGGAGDDLLVGGAGHDNFVFSGGGGNDVVLDFQVGEDMLSISKGINDTDISSADDVAARATQDGANTVVDLGNGDSITLNNVDVDDVQDHPDHFFNVQ